MSVPPPPSHSPQLSQSIFKYFVLNKKVLMAFFHTQLLASGISSKSQFIFVIRWTQTTIYTKLLLQKSQARNKLHSAGSKAGSGYLGRNSNACKPDPDQPNTLLFLLSPNSWEQPQKSVLCLVQGSLS